MSNVTPLRIDVATAATLEAEAPEVPGFEDMPPVMTPKTLAQQLETTVTTLQRWRDSNDGPAYVKVPGTRLIRYLRPDVLAWLSTGRVETKGKAS
ncbi:helix-turn-helix transcriptional regulator [Microbacterium sp. KNMS]